MNVKQGSAGRRLRMPSPAMIVACIALAVALSGASYAAVVLPRNSVGTVQLKRDAVTSPKVKGNALTGADINEARLTRVPSATNAEKLDGLDSSVFAHSDASLRSSHSTYTAAADSGLTTIGGIAFGGVFQVYCGAPGSGAQIWYRNVSPNATHEIWMDDTSGGYPSDAHVASLPPESGTAWGTISQSTAAPGRPALHYTIVVTSGVYYARVEIMLARRASTWECFGTLEVNWQK